MMKQQKDSGKPALMAFRTFYVKSFEKHQRLINLTRLHIALNPIQVDSRIKLAIISD